MGESIEETLTDSFDPLKVKVILFDVFGTLVDVSTVPTEEKRRYVRATQQTPRMNILPPASWDELPTFPEVVDGIARLRDDVGLFVVTLSNLPIVTQAVIFRNNGVIVDAMIDLETDCNYKPRAEAYKRAEEVLRQFDKESFLMVSANVGFGDASMAWARGWQGIHIRGKSKIEDVRSLAMLIDKENND